MPVNWHHRFLQQASWTRQLRAYLIDKAAPSGGEIVLEVGCGTGAVLSDFAGGSSHISSQFQMFGIDIDPGHIIQAMNHFGSASYSVGDAHCLPFNDSNFDITFCHYLLLWVKDAKKCVQEMVRVTRPGGFVLLFAEPDYGGRIDHPEPYMILGDLQVQALKNQGADPFMGRKIRSLLSDAGLEKIEAGIMGAEWNSQDQMDDIEMEWAVLDDDIRNLLPPDSLADLISSLRISPGNANRIWFVPTFFAMGQVTQERNTNRR